MIYADTSSLPVFFGNEGVVPTGRLERFKEEMTLLSNHSLKCGVTGNSTPSAKKKKKIAVDSGTNVCLIEDLSKPFNP